MTRRTYDPNFNPDEVNRQVPLHEILAEQIMSVYKPLSGPVQQYLVETFSKNVQEEAGFRYGYLPKNITSSVDSALVSARQRLFDRPLGPEVPGLVQSMAKMGHLTTDREALYWKDPQIVSRNISGAGLRYSDFETLVGLSAPGKTYRDLQDVIYGSYSRALVNYAANRKYSDRFDALQNVSTGLLGNIDRFNPGAATESANVSYWLMGRAFAYDKANDDSIKRAFTLADYTPTDQIKAAASVLDTFGEMYGVSAFSILQKRGIATDGVLNPDIANYILENKASLLGYDQGGLGLVESGSPARGDSMGEDEFAYNPGSLVPDVAEGQVLYTGEPNAMARLLPTMIPSAGLSLGLYSRNGSLFDNNNQLNSLERFTFGSEKLPRSMWRPRDFFNNYAVGNYFTGDGSVVDAHRKGLTISNPVNAGNRNRLIRSGAFKNINASPEEIGRFLNMDTTGFSGRQQEDYNRVHKLLRNVYSQLNATTSGTEYDSETIQDLFSQVHEDDILFKPSTARYLTIPENAVFRKDILKQRLDPLTGRIGYIDPETHEVLSENDVLNASFQWRPEESPESTLANPLVRKLVVRKPKILPEIT